MAGAAGMASKMSSGTLEGMESPAGIGPPARQRTAKHGLHIGRLCLAFTEPEEEGVGPVLPLLQKSFREFPHPREEINHERSRCAGLSSQNGIQHIHFRTQRTQSASRWMPFGHRWWLARHPQTYSRPLAWSLNRIAHRSRTGLFASCSSRSAFCWAPQPQRRLNGLCNSWAADPAHPSSL